MKFMLKTIAVLVIVCSPLSGLELGEVSAPATSAEMSSKNDEQTARMTVSATASGVKPHPESRPGDLPEEHLHTVTLRPSIGSKIAVIRFLGRHSDDPFDPQAEVVPLFGFHVNETFDGDQPYIEFSSSRLYRDWSPTIPMIWKFKCKIKAIMGGRGFTYQSLGHEGTILADTQPPVIYHDYHGVDVVYILKIGQKTDGGTWYLGLLVGDFSYNEVMKLQGESAIDEVKLFQPFSYSAAKNLEAEPPRTVVETTGHP